MAEAEISVHVDTSEVDAAREKVEHLSELLKEARTLAGELASMKIDLPFEIKG